MTKLLKLSLIILSLFALAGGAFAYQLSVDEVKNEIIEQVTKEAKSYTQGDIEVIITGMVFSGLKTQGEKAPYIKVISNQKRFMHKDIKRVVISDGKEVLASFPVNVTVLVYKDVLVARGPIASFAVVTPSNSELRRMEVGLHIQKVITEAEGAKQLIATRNFSDGALILKPYTRSKPDIVRNTGVNLVFYSNEGMNIQMEGVALGEGNVGDTVLVRNTRYNKVHSGTIVGENEIMVRI
ncbi:flagellar basal body P-ring biosynthesis protein-like protein [Candidatus Gastranaerophilus sp. (ex Termes propinquus)]|nr:flagellar basal body P-ring biosynthesis protein-like protein [Candidatus Gastranaerophilus sp. (ex Termes propinquus)]